MGIRGQLSVKFTYFVEVQKNTEQKKHSNSVNLTQDLKVKILGLRSSRPKLF